MPETGRRIVNHALRLSPIEKLPTGDWEFESSASHLRTAQVPSPATKLTFAVSTVPPRLPGASCQSQ
jgi:hypothetical protein